jgi:ribosome-associated protein
MPSSPSPHCGAQWSESPLLEPAEAARRIIDVLSDRQAEDVLLLDVRQVAGFADYFIIATAENSRHMRALVDVLEKDLRNDGVKARHVEGERDGGWVLMDYGDIVLHLFSEEMREFYALEELWSAGTQVVRIQ